MGHSEKLTIHRARATLTSWGNIVIDVEVAMPVGLSEQQREFLEVTEGVVETFRQEAVLEGIARTLVDIYEMRFGTMPDDARAIVRRLQDESALRAWVKLAAGGGADEVLATIRTPRVKEPR